MNNRNDDTIGVGFINLVHIFSVWPWRRYLTCSTLVWSRYFHFSLRAIGFFNSEPWMGIRNYSHQCPWFPRSNISNVRSGKSRTLMTIISNYIFCWVRCPLCRALFMVLYVLYIGHILVSIILLPSRNWSVYSQFFLIWRTQDSTIKIHGGSGGKL